MPEGKNDMNLKVRKGTQGGEPQWVCAICPLRELWSVLALEFRLGTMNT